MKIQNLNPSYLKNYNSRKNYNNKLQNKPALKQQAIQENQTNSLNFTSYSTNLFIKRLREQQARDDEFKRLHNIPVEEQTQKEPTQGIKNLFEELDTIQKGAGAILKEAKKYAKSSAEINYITQFWGLEKNSATVKKDDKGNIVEKLIFKNGKIDRIINYKDKTVTVFPDENPRFYEIYTGCEDLESDTFKAEKYFSFYQNNLLVYMENVTTNLESNKTSADKYYYFKFDSLNLYAEGYSSSDKEKNKEYDRIFKAKIDFGKLLYSPAALSDSDKETDNDNPSQDFIYYKNCKITDYIDVKAEETIDLSQYKHPKTDK